MGCICGLQDRRTRQAKIVKKYFQRLGSGGHKKAMPVAENGRCFSSKRYRSGQTFFFHVNKKLCSYIWEHSMLLMTYAKQLTVSWMPYRPLLMDYSSPTERRTSLTLAWQNPEHPGRTRGKGVVAWKYEFEKALLHGSMSFKMTSTHTGVAYEAREIRMRS